MNGMQWAIVTIGAAVPLYLGLRCLRWHTFLPVPGRAQNVRAVCRHQVQWDVETAVARAIRESFR